MGGLVRRVTAMWPRSAAERFAERVFAQTDASRDALLEGFSSLGDDSFELHEAGVDLGDPVLSDFPDCSCAGALAADLMDHRPDCAARTGLGPAGERIPRQMPPAGHLDPPIAGNTPAAESEAQSSAAGHLNVGHDELSARILASFGYRRYDLRRFADNAASDLLAEYRIVQKSTPPAPFTSFRDIAHAAQLIRDYLANRLADAAAADPHP